MLLKDIIEFKNGKKKPSSKGIVPIYGGNGILGYTAQNNQDGESLIIGRVGSYCGCVYSHYGKCWISDNAIVGKVKEGNDFYYCYYLLKTLNLNSRHVGSGQPLMTQEILNNIEANTCDYKIQKKIGRILKNIDDKIEKNNEINNNLSEQLKTVFYEWFESKMTDNLPDGWVIADLQDVSTFSQGVQVPIEEQIEKEKDGFVRFIRIVDITQGSDKEIRYIEDRDRGHVVENEIFMTRYGTPGILSRNYNGIIANNLFKISPSAVVTSNYLFSALNVDRIQNYIKGNATSSTMPAISFSTLNHQKVIVPDRETLGKFDKYSETIRKKQLNIINENKKLVQLRDTLLLRLMNGEIDLDNIEI